MAQRDAGIVDCSGRVALFARLEYNNNTIFHANDHQFEFVRISCCWVPSFIHIFITSICSFVINFNIFFFHHHFSLYVAVRASTFAFVLSNRRCAMLFTCDWITPSHCAHALPGKTFHSFFLSFHRLVSMIWNAYANVYVEIIFNAAYFNDKSHVAAIDAPALPIKTQSHSPTRNLPTPQWHRQPCECQLQATTSDKYNIFLPFRTINNHTNQRWSIFIYMNCESFTDIAIHARPASTKTICIRPNWSATRRKRYVACTSHIIIFHR